jgi:hypothetical protein
MVEIKRCKRKIKRKTDIYKYNTRLNLNYSFPGNGARKGGLLTVYMCIKLRLDLQADKFSVVVKGPFFP